MLNGDPILHCRRVSQRKLAIKFALFSCLLFLQGEPGPEYTFVQEINCTKVRRYRPHFSIIYLTIICRRRSEYCGIIPETKSRGLIIPIFTSPEENNCFSIIAQVIMRASAFSFFFSPETSKIARWPF